MAVSARAYVAALVRRNLRDDELGKAGIALSLALLTVLAAVVAGLQGQASIEAQRGNREAQRIGLEATGRNVTSVIQIGTAYGIYRRWFEQLERSNWATDQQTRAVNASNRPELDALQQAEAAIGDWTKAQTDLLKPPYYNGTSADFAAFEADRITGPQTLANEQRSIEADVASLWGAKASDYVTVLTVLAVGLFFLGLGSTVGRRGRPLLASAGVVFGTGALIWTVAIATAPIHRVPQAAIDQVVAATVTLGKTPNNQGQPTLSDAARKGFQTAIQQADAAVAADAGYASAYRVRAETKVAFGDALFFASGPGDEVTTIVKGAIDDYHRYLLSRPDDYAGWWNLGWSEYLAGNNPASVDATNQALLRSPAQFTLYLNRALAFLAGGDPKQALKDVDAAILRAGMDSSASSQYYLGQSDFDIGRLATIYPAQADVLRGVQRRLREAQVALRVFGTINPASDAPKPGPISVIPVQMKRYSGGTLVEGTPLKDGGSVAATDAVGVRVSVGGAGALQGRTVSARIWVDGLAQAGYNQDLTVKGDRITLDLVSTYGRAGFALDPGLYGLDLYIDGARRFQTSWTVLPRPDKPQYITTATPFLGALKGVNFVCGDPKAATGKTTVSCSVKDADQTSYFADVTWDAQDRITYVVLSTVTPSGSTVDVNKLGHDFFVSVVKVLYPPDLATTAAAWINQRNTDVDDIDIGGTTLRVYGNDANTRNMDIWSPWP
jgi:tetratricopeptide (TPR) repeat protein